MKTLSNNMKKRTKTDYNIYTLPAKVNTLEFNLKLVNAYRNHVIQAVLQSTGIDVRYLGKDGLTNWCKDFHGMMESIESLEHFVKGATAGLYALRKLNPKGPLALSNLTYFIPLTNITKTNKQHSKIISSKELSRYDFTHNYDIKTRDTIKKFSSGKVILREVKNISLSTKIAHRYEIIVYPTLANLPPSWKPYWDISGEKHTLRQMAKIEGVPYAKLNHTMEKHRDLSISDAVNKVILDLVNEFENSLWAKAKNLKWSSMVTRWQKRWPGLTERKIRDVIAKNLIPEKNLLNIEKVKKTFNRTLGNAKPIYLWNKWGLVKKFETTEAASVELGVTSSYLSTLCTTGKQTKAGYWVSRTSDIPETALTALKTFKVKQMLFKAIQPLADLALSPTQQNILFYLHVENKNLQEISELFNMTENQIEHLALIGTDNIKQMVEVLTSPKLGKDGEGIAFESYQDAVTGELDSSRARKTVSADAALAGSIRAGLNKTKPFSPSIGKDSVGKKTKVKD